MKKALKKIEYKIWYYKNNERTEGAPPDIRGNLTGISGNLTDCEITDEERKKGISIEELIEG